MRRSRLVVCALGLALVAGDAAIAFPAKGTSATPSEGPPRYYLVETAIRPGGSEGEGFGDRVVADGALIGTCTGHHANNVDVFEWANDAVHLRYRYESDYSGPCDIDATRLVIGMPNDNGGVGSVQVLRSQGSTYTFEQALVASDGKPYDLFGRDLAIDGDLIAVAAATSFPSTDSYFGNAYAFRWDGATWVEEAILGSTRDLVADSPWGSDGYGHTIDASGDLIVVGADWDDAAGSDAGAAYVYKWDGTDWDEIAKLLGDSSNDFYGHSVAVDEDRVVIGGFQHVDVYKVIGEEVVLSQRLEGIPAHWRFGSLAISGNLLVVGDVLNLGGDYADPERPPDYRRAAHVFWFDGSVWVFSQTLMPPVPGPHQGRTEYANPLGIGDGFIVVGENNDDNRNGDGAGAIHIYVPYSGIFYDDEESVFEADIEWMATEGITKGCNPPDNDRYCPTANVTRGQMAAFLVRALDLTERLDDPFSDDDDSIFEADIEKLAAAGITKGCNPTEGNTKFCPDSKVTREQMAAFLVRALHYVDDGGGDLFLDDDDSIFEHDIDCLGTAGVTKGCNPAEGNTKFCPKGYVTRGQMAAFLHRALG